MEFIEIYWTIPKAQSLTLGSLEGTCVNGVIVWMNAPQNAVNPPPSSLTWHSKNNHLKMYILLNMEMFQVVPLSCELSGVYALTSHPGVNREPEIYHPQAICNSQGKLK